MVGFFFCYFVEKISYIDIKNISLDMLDNLWKIQLLIYCSCPLNTQSTFYHHHDNKKIVNKTTTHKD